MKKLLYLFFVLLFCFKRCTAHRCITYFNIYDSTSVTIRLVSLRFQESYRVPRLRVVPRSPRRVLRGGC